MNKPNDKKCLNPACDRDRVVRGLCCSCYSTMSRYVRKGATTWEAMEAAGKCAPKRSTKYRGMAKWMFDGEHECEGDGKEP